MSSVQIKYLKRLPRLALYFSILVLPGGSIGVLLLYWLQHGKGKPGSTRASVRPGYRQLRSVWKDQYRALADRFNGLRLPGKTGVAGGSPVSQSTY